jgi:toxin ParE1/3/4
MARYRLSQLAKVDLLQILSTSEERWGVEGRRRYAAVIASAIRKVADDPKGPATQDRSELLTGSRSMHLRYARTLSSVDKVRNPVHVLYYRVIAPDFVEILRVLHERMEPSRHVGVQITD